MKLNPEQKCERKLGRLVLYTLFFVVALWAVVISVAAWMQVTHGG